MSIKNILDAKILGVKIFSIKRLLVAAAATVAVVTIYPPPEDYGADIDTEKCFKAHHADNPFHTWTPCSAKMLEHIDQKERDLAKAVLKIEADEDKARAAARSREKAFGYSLNYKIFK